MRSGGSSCELGEGELGGAVDRDEQVEPPLLGAHLAMSMWKKPIG
jgi:hypothetical protein